MTKKIIIIIVLLIILSLGIFWVFTRNKPNALKQNSTTISDIKKAELDAKKQEFNNMIKQAISKDNDGDGLTDEEEAKLGTNPRNADTDGDGLLDGAETKVYHTDPLKADTDGDGTSDGREVWLHTNPLDSKIHP